MIREQVAQILVVVYNPFLLSMRKPSKANGEAHESSLRLASARPFVEHSLYAVPMEAKDLSIWDAMPARLV